MAADPALRILLVLGTSGGGVRRHVASLAEGLVESGQTVVVAGPESVREAIEAAAPGVRLASVPIAERPSPTRDPRSIARLRRLIRGSDVVDAHGLRAGGLAALARGRHGPPPLVVTLHNALLAGGVVAAAYGGLERIVARRADLVLAVSGDLAERQRRLGARRVDLAVVPAPEAVGVRKGRDDTRAGLGVSASTPLVVSVARLAEQKGLPALLDMSAELAVPVPGVRVVVAGGGPLESVLGQRISAESLPVDLLGWREDVPDLLAAADVAVSSAVWEGQPIWLQEALRAGCPVVATDVGGTADVLGPAGVLVPPGDVGALAHEVAAILSDPGRRAEQSEASLARAAELPDRAASVAATLRRYRDLSPAPGRDC